MCTVSGQFVNDDDDDDNADVGEDDDDVHGGHCLLISWAGAPTRPSNTLANTTAILHRHHHHRLDNAMQWG